MASSSANFVPVEEQPRSSVESNSTYFGDFKLTMWIPAELGGKVIGTKGIVISNLTRETQCKLIKALRPVGNSLWTAVVIMGSASSCKAAYDAIAEMVFNEVDDVVLEFPFNKKRFHFITGFKGLEIIRKISAETCVRVFIPEGVPGMGGPTEEDLGGSGHVYASLEGACDAVYRAFEMFKDAYKVSLTNAINKAKVDKEEESRWIRGMVREGQQVPSTTSTAAVVSSAGAGAGVGTQASGARGKAPPVASSSGAGAGASTAAPSTRGQRPGQHGETTGNTATAAAHAGIAAGQASTASNKKENKKDREVAGASANAHAPSAASSAKPHSSGDRVKPTSEATATEEGKNVVGDSAGEQDAAGDDDGATAEKSPEETRPAKGPPPPPVTACKRDLTIPARFVSLFLARKPINGKIPKSNLMNQIQKSTFTVVSRVKGRPVFAKKEDGAKAGEGGQEVDAGAGADDTAGADAVVKGDETTEGHEKEGEHEEGDGEEGEEPKEEGGRRRRRAVDDDEEEEEGEDEDDVIDSDDEIDEDEEGDEHDHEEGDGADEQEGGGEEEGASTQDKKGDGEVEGEGDAEVDDTAEGADGADGGPNDPVAFVVCGPYEENVEAAYKAITRIIDGDRIKTVLSVLKEGTIKLRKPAWGDAMIEGVGLIGSSRDRDRPIRPKFSTSGRFGAPAEGGRFGGRFASTSRGSGSASGFLRGVGGRFAGRAGRESSGRGRGLSSGRGGRGGRGRGGGGPPAEAPESAASAREDSGAGAGAATKKEKFAQKRKPAKGAEGGGASAVKDSE